MEPMYRVEGKPLSSLALSLVEFDSMNGSGMKREVSGDPRKGSENLIPVPTSNLKPEQKLAESRKYRLKWSR